MPSNANPSKNQMLIAAVALYPGASTLTHLVQTPDEIEQFGVDVERLPAKPFSAQPLIDEIAEEARGWF